QPPDPGEGYRMLYIGNSLTGQLTNNQIRVDGRRPRGRDALLGSASYYSPTDNRLQLIGEVE
ncbi:MAG: hypothetical protein ACOC4K_01340, partial [Verrucomicrobiota bacterium]